MEARVDLDDHTAQFYTSKVIGTIISMYFNVFLGMNPRSLSAQSTCAFNRMRQGGVEGTLWQCEANYKGVASR
jgi:hypothetical protein